MAVRIAVDAMGGDFAPRAAVHGALEALCDSSDLQINLVGDQDRISAELDERADSLTAARLQIVHASQVVDMDDAPVDAMRTKKDSSIVRAVELCAEGRTDAVVSAGNTGATAAACQFKIKPLSVL